jgi:hypothetical protein
MNGRAVPRNSSEQCSDVAAATEEKASPTMTALIEQLNRDLDELQTTLLGGNKGGQLCPVAYTSTLNLEDTPEPIEPSRLRNYPKGHVLL